MTDINKAMWIDPKYKDPEYEYAWGLDHTYYLTGALVDGYEMVKVSDKDGQKFVAAGDPRVRTADGTIRVGDAPLMRIKKDRKAERERDVRARNSGRIKTIKEDFKGSVGSLGMEAFEDPTP